MSEPTTATRAPVVVRASRPEDAAAVLALLAAAALPTAGVAEGFEHFVVAESEGALVGAAGLEQYGSDGLLRSVVVAPSWRGRALGSALTDAVLVAAQRAGLERVYLLTDTAADFFPRHGFRRIAREEASEAVRASSEFRELCPASAVVMMRALTPSAAESA